MFGALDLVHTCLAPAHRSGWSLVPRPDPVYIGSVPPPMRFGGKFGCAVFRLWEMCWKLRGEPLCATTPLAHCSSVGVTIRSPYATGSYPWGSVGGSRVVLKVSRSCMSSTKYILEHLSGLSLHPLGHICRRQPARHSSVCALIVDNTPRKLQPIHAPAPQPVGASVGQASAINHLQTVYEPEKQSYNGVSSIIGTECTGCGND